MAGAGLRLRASTEAGADDRPYREYVPWPRVLTFAAVVPAVLLAGSGIVAVAVSPTAADVLLLALLLVPGLGSLALGLMVGRRLPTNPVAPLIAWNGAVALTLTGDVYDAAVARRPTCCPR